MSTPAGIVLDALSVNFDERFQLNDINWRVQERQHWMIAGANGSGKSALAAVLAGAGDIVSGRLSGLPERVALVSYETQAALIEAERRKDDADIMDVISLGTPVAQILAQQCVDAQLCSELVSQFGLSHLLERAFRQLSTGETRKVMLVRALVSRPNVLVIDEPYDGLDSNTQPLLLDFLTALSSTVQIIVVLNRVDECPEFVTNIAFMDQGELRLQIARDNERGIAELHQLLHLKTSDLTLPPADPATRVPALDPAQPLVRLNQVQIRYGETEIFSNLSWTIEPNQHWQLTGPNGSGKTGLLSLITGDHPQCYVNDIYVFGFQRGNGESIWQIKQYIGYVSTALQWEYRVSISLRNVIISGFYDSIGLYTKHSDAQRDIANQWLQLLGMASRADQPFNQLSFGDQRLLLIARAMVKHPPLLILDEPCNGLDDMNRQLVLALIEKICSGSETSVLYVNHHPDDKIAGIEHYLAL